MHYLRHISLALGTALAIMAAPVQATESGDGDAGTYVKPFMKVVGKTLPPIGYVQFCEANPSECRFGKTKAVRVRMSDSRWNELVKVNDFVNGRISPVTDQDLYNTPELWTYPERSGDCEDYVLLKRRHLIDLGWPPQTLLITVVRDIDNGGHAVLTVVTDLGDFILDNQNPDILPWMSTRYTYHKRQSQNGPNNWVSLQDSASRTSRFMTGDLER